MLTNHGVKLILQVQAFFLLLFQILVKQLGKVAVAGFQLVNGFPGLGKLVQQTPMA